MPARRTSLLAVVALALGVPAGASAGGRGDARAFTRATLAFDLARGRAVGRAERLGDARRTAALACAQTVQRAPASRRAQLLTLYATWVSAGYFAEDEPMFARWVAALQAIPTQDAALRAARRSLARELALERTIHGQGRAFCPPVERWAGAGWTTRGRPTVVRRLEQLLPPDVPSTGIAASARRLRASGGAGGALAADVLRDGITEPQATIIQRDDPLVALLAPPS